MKNIFRISGVILLIFLIHFCKKKEEVPVITTAFSQFRKVMLSFLFFLLLPAAGNAQEITFTEMLSWINTEEYPTHFFGELELKGFSFAKNVQYSDCTGYQYNSNKNNEDYRCFITAFICESNVTAFIPIEVARRYEIQSHKGGKIV